MMAKSDTENGWRPIPSDELLRMTPRQQMKYMLAESAHTAHAAANPNSKPDSISSNTSKPEMTKKVLKKHEENRIPKRGRGRPRNEPDQKVNTKKTARSNKVPNGKAIRSKGSELKPNLNGKTDSLEVDTARNVKLVIKFRKESGEWSPTSGAAAENQNKRSFDKANSNSPSKRHQKQKKTGASQPMSDTSSDESEIEYESESETEEEESESDEAELSSASEESKSETESESESESEVDDQMTDVDKRMIRKCHSCCEYTSVAAIRVPSECKQEYHHGVCKDCRTIARKKRKSIGKKKVAKLSSLRCVVCEGECLCKRCLQHANVVSGATPLLKIETSTYKEEQVEKKLLATEVSKDEDVDDDDEDDNVQVDDDLMGETMTLFCLKDFRRLAAWKHAALQARANAKQIHVEKSSRMSKNSISSYIT